MTDPVDLDQLETAMRAAMENKFSPKYRAMINTLLLAAPELIRLARIGRMAEHLFGSDDTLREREALLVELRELRQFKLDTEILREHESTFRKLAEAERWNLPAEQTAREWEAAARMLRDDLSAVQAEIARLREVERVVREWGKANDAYRAAWSGEACLKTSARLAHAVSDARDAVEKLADSLAAAEGGGASK